MKKNRKCNNKSINLINNVLILVIIFLVLHILSNSLFASKTVAYTEQVVLRGQTLWSIAEDISCDYDKDIYEVMYDIKNLNNMDESTLYEGQLLNIPSYL